MRVRLGFSSLLLGAFAGCAPLSGPTPDLRYAATNAPVLDASVAAVWQVLPAVYDRLNLHVSFADTITYTLTSTRAVNLWLPVVGPSRAPYARCVLPALVQTVVGGASGRGMPLRLPPGRIMLAVETLLEPVEERTRVQTRVRTSPVALEHTIEPGEPYCVSTGRLEEQIAELLRAQLNASEVAP